MDVLTTGDGDGEASPLSSAGDASSTGENSSSSGSSTGESSSTGEPGSSGNCSTGEPSSTGDTSATGQEQDLPACADGAQPIVGNSLEDTLALLGRTGILQVDVAVPVTADVMIPEGIDVCFIHNGRFEIASHVTVSIGGQIQAEQVLIFDYADDTSAVVAPQVATVVPQWWGAKGNNANNDTDALRRASSFISTRGGGTLFLPSGTYIVGEQTLAGAEGLNGSWLEETILHVHDCGQPVVIAGEVGEDKTILRAADGLRFGSFDPIDGTAVEPKLPFTDLDHRADAYVGMVQLSRNSDVTVRNLELDGNQDGLELGGPWGDTGYQLYGTGIWAQKNDKLVVEDIYTHHQPLDGLSVGYPGLTAEHAPTPTTLNRVVSEYNGRQGLSWVGGIGLTATDCSFNHTGRARIASAPGAGLDIEAEGSICRAGKFVNCEFINNVGAGMVADSGDGGYSTFSGCTFWGTTMWSVYPRKPRLVFEDCKIYGSIPQPVSAANPEDGVRFSGCIIEDLEHPDFGVFRHGALVHADSKNLVIEDSEIIAHQVRALYIDGNLSKERLSNVDITHGYDALPDKGFQSLIRGAYLEDVRFHEDIDTPPINGWYISVENVIVGPGVHVDCPYVKWKNWSWGLCGDIPPT